MIFKTKGDPNGRLVPIPKGTEVEINIEENDPSEYLSQRSYNQMQNYYILRATCGSHALGYVDDKDVKVLLSLRYWKVIDLCYCVEKAVDKFTIDFTKIKCKIYLKTDVFTEPVNGYDYDKKKMKARLQ